MPQPWLSSQAHLKECDLIKRYFSGDYKATGTDAPSGPTSNEEKGDAYPDL
jgi:hypothetical protein